MGENEFFYWLQGFFELTLLGGPATLSPARAECIKRHVALVRESLQRGERLGECVARIELIADMALDPAALDDRMHVLTARLRAEVDAQFEHVIDPQAGDGEQQAKLNVIHSGSRPPQGGRVKRC